MIAVARIDWRIVKVRLAAFFVVFALVCAWWSAQAQAPGANPEDVVITRITDQLKALTALGDRIGAIAQDDQKLLQARIDAEAASRELINASVAFRPIMADINARLDAARVTVPEGEPLPDAVQAQINLLNTRKAAINAALVSAEDGTVVASSVIERVGQMRRDLFTSTLSQRVSIRPVFTQAVWQEVRAEFFDLTRRVTSWATFTLRFKAASMVWALMLALSAALAFAIVSRRFFAPALIERHGGDNPSYLLRVLSATASSLLPTAALAVFLIGLIVLFTSFQLLRPDITDLLAALFGVVLLVFFIQRLARAVLRPSAPAWRLVSVRQAVAAPLIWLITALGVVTGLDLFLEAVSNVLDAPFSLTIGRSVLFVVLNSALLIALAFVRPFQTPEGSALGWPKALKGLLLAVGLVPLAAVGLGYAGFARFATQQVVITSAIIVAMSIGFMTARALGQENALRQTNFGHMVQTRFALSDARLDSLALVASLATYAIVAIFGVPLILMQWGFQLADIILATTRFMTDIRIGSVSISITSILIGIVIFLIGYFLSRRFEGWLDQNVLARSRIDRGARASIRTAVGYAGIAIAVLVGVSVAGIDLSSFALVAGALSLGIGFGLQNIVSNFVSGLILLAERPFKEGDWIEAAGINGIVKKVSVRATEIETFQKQSVILPNSNLINQAVGNWTHRNTLARVDIAVGVSYGADVIRVQEILRAVALDHPKALKTPAPFVMFKSFGAERLEFELRFHIADLFEQVGVQTDVRFEIIRRFRAEGVDTRFMPEETPLGGLNENAGVPTDHAGAAIGVQPPDPTAAIRPVPAAKAEPLPKRGKS
ncbi:MAG: mechanosensitive ion channel [Rhizobiaceae bacterium]|jgi:small-conductance mechanosensitive channel|nr:mechanosensitive ion channel [Rhizobiaceae bacterium]